MKKLILLNFALFLFLSENVYSQSKFGEVSMDELTMTSYPEDSTAVAVILSKIGDTRFTFNSSYGFRFEYTIKTKIKILRTEGLEWCDQQVEYYDFSSSNKESISGLSGTTYNLVDGKIERTKLSKEHIFEEDVEKKYKVKKFSLPAAKVGSIIEYKYTIESPHLYNLRDFAFQSSIPTMYVSYDITIPEYFIYNVDTQGYIPIKNEIKTTTENFNVRYKDDNGHLQLQNIRCSGKRTIFTANNVPAMKDEAYLWTKNDFISKVSYELRSINFPYTNQQNASNTWENIDKELREAKSFGDNLNRPDLFKDEITKTEISYDRAKEILGIVKNKAKWDERNSFYPSNLKDVLKNGIGNSTDVNFLLINALKSGGFNAFPVLMSTRYHGRMPITHPSISAFNYIITGIVIDTLLFFTDASAKYGNWNTLPEKCMVPQARILADNFSDWVDLSTISRGAVMKYANVSFSDSQILAAIKETRSGNTGYNGRVSYESYKDQKSYIEYLSKNFSAQIDDFSITDLDKTDKPLVMEYTQVQDINLGNDFLYINPLAERLITDNLFKAEDRVYPIQFNHLFNYTQIVDFKIPEGYAVEELPKSERFILNDKRDIMFSYQTTAENDVIKVHLRYILNKLEFLPDEYQDLREFFSKVVLKNSEQIVLKKIKNE